MGKDYGVHYRAQDQSGRNSTFCFHLVCFYDLLAQQTELENLRVLPGDSSAQAKYLNSIEATLGRVRWLRDFLSTFVTNFLTPFSAGLPTNAPAESVSRYQRYLEVPLHLQAFGDTTLVYFAFPEGDASFAARSTIGTLLGIGYVHLKLLADGVPARGGVEVDIGCGYLDGQVYGPVLSRAYQLESKVAQGPRIAVGPGLLEWLNAMQGRTGSSTEDKVAAKVGQYGVDCLTTDEDGTLILHLLGPAFRRLHSLGPGMRLAEYIRPAYQFVADSAHRFRGDKPLGDRYARLQRYFERYMGDWN